MCDSAKVLVDGSQFVFQLGLEVGNDLCVAFGGKPFGTELYIFMYQTSAANQKTQKLRVCGVTAFESEKRS